MFRLSRPSLALQPFHFLKVHDALVELFPKASIKAFHASNKMHPFQTDMVCLLEGYERMDVVNHVQRIQAKMLAVELSEQENLIDIRFHDKEVLTLTFGIPNVTMDDLNDSETMDQRLLMRESFGSSEALFLQYMDDTIMRGADYLMGTFSSKLDRPTVDLPPRSYFAAHILRQARRHGIANDVNYALWAQIEMSTKFIERPSNIILPFDNPFCPGEDWHMLPMISEFLQDIEDDALRQ